MNDHEPKAVKVDETGVCEKCRGKGYVWGWHSSPLDWEKRECPRCLGTGAQP